MSEPSLPVAPYSYVPSTYEARLTGAVRRMAFKGLNPQTTIWGFDDNNITKKGLDADGLSTANDPTTSAAMVRMKYMNAINRIRSGYRPNFQDSYGLLVLGHELGHLSNKQHDNEKLADSYGYSAYSKLANMMGITNPKKIRLMLTLARYQNGESVVLPKAYGGDGN